MRRKSPIRTFHEETQEIISGYIRTNRGDARVVETPVMNMPEHAWAQIVEAIYHIKKHLESADGAKIQKPLEEIRATLEEVKLAVKKANEAMDAFHFSKEWQVSHKWKVRSPKRATLSNVMKTLRDQSNILNNVSGGLAKYAATEDNAHPASAYHEYRASDFNQEYFKDRKSGLDLAAQCVTDARSALNAYIATYVRTMQGHHNEKRL